MITKSLLRFIPLGQKYFSELHQIHQDSEFRKYLMEEMEMSLEDTQEVIDANEDFMKDNPVGLLLIQLGDEYIGYCGFRNTHEASDHIDLMYGIKGKYFGQGLGSTIVSELIKIHHNSGSNKKITAVTAPLNIASNKILEKNGFKRLGPASGQLSHLIAWSKD